MVTMWVCTRHTRMHWFKSPWTPPCLVPLTKFIQESKLVQSPVLSKRGETILHESSPLSRSHFQPFDVRGSDPPTSDTFRMRLTVPIYKRIPFFFFVVVCSPLSSPLLSSFYLLFLCKTPQKADFGQDPSGVKRQKVSPEEEKVDSLGKMVDKYKPSQHQHGDRLSGTPRGKAEN